MKKTVIGSSYGSFTIDGQGNVLDVDWIEVDIHLKHVKRFDVEEYKQHYKKTELPEYIDILDIGYWLKDGTLEEPVAEWRDRSILNL